MIRMSYPLQTAFETLGSITPPPTPQLVESRPGAKGSWHLSSVVGICAVGMLTALGCGNSGGGTKGGTLQGPDAAAFLSSAIFIPNEGAPLASPTIDETITVSPVLTGTNGTPALVNPGDVIMVQLPFEAMHGNVVGAGMRFGDAGPVRTVPVAGAQGQTSGTLAFSVQVPADICGNLSQICHDIRGYEFAITSTGQVSRANVTDIAVLCGTCAEPSCDGLLDCPDVDEGTPVSPGLNECETKAREIEARAKLQCGIPDARDHGRLTGWCEGGDDEECFAEVSTWMSCIHASGTIECWEPDPSDPALPLAVVLPEPCTAESSAIDVCRFGAPDGEPTSTQVF